MESRIIQPKIEIVDSLKLIGHVRATMFKNGDFKHPIVCNDVINTIQADCKKYLAGAIEKTVTYALDDLFTAVATDPTQSKDGIYVLVGALKYSLKCTGDAANTDYTLGWSGENAARKLTGELTGHAGTIAATTSVWMGYNFEAAGPAFTKPWATPGSWSSLTLASALDYLYIEWTITIAQELTNGFHR